MGGDGGLHDRVKKAGGIAAGGLGLVHGHVGFFEQIVNRVVVLHEHHNADAGRAVVAVAAQVVGQGQRIQNFVGHHLGLGCGVARLAA